MAQLARRGGWFDAPRLAIFLGVFGLARVAGAAPDAAGSEAPPGSVERYFSRLLVGIQKTEFENGLQVVLDVERGAPLVAVSMTFPAGRNHGGVLPELVDALRHRRITGAATDHALVRARGATSYQSAGWDHSTFTEVLPPDELPFALWLEGQRLRPLSALPAATDAFASEAERAFAWLRAERRASFELEHLAWPAPAAEASGVNLLNQVWFEPRRAVLTVSGDFDGDEALRLLDEYVSDGISAARPATPETTTGEVLPGAERTRALPADALDTTLSIGFVVAGAADAGHAAVTLAAALLDGTHAISPGPLFGSSATLAASVGVGEASGRSLLAIHTRRRAPERGALTPRSVFDELQRLARRPLTEPALGALRKAVLIRWLDQFASVKQRSELLGRYEVLHGDARLAARFARDLANVSANDVRRVLATLTADRALIRQPLAQEVGR